MIIGIDMGGTHTDGVLLFQGQVLKSKKVLTDENNITDTIIDLLSQLMEGQDKNALRRIVLSTTIVTNLLSKNQESQAGLFIIPGLGAPKSLVTSVVNAVYAAESGYVDHRGVVIEPLSVDDLEKAADFFSGKGLKSICVVGKFSVRNHELEKKAALFFRGRGFEVFEGAAYSGKLNFPRRAFTTYLSAIIFHKYQESLGAIQKGVASLDLKAPLYILKADGGAVLLSDSLKYPVESILSGPAASIMGAFFHQKEMREGDTLVLDIGGTTTDVGFFINGVPILEPEGIKIKEFNTLIRALKVFPLALGGDTLFRFSGEQAILDNKREGVAYLFGGPRATHTDLLAYLEQGDAKAGEGLQKELGTGFSEKLSRIKERLKDFLKVQVERYLALINDRPIYTVNEFFQKKIFSPRRIFLVGGGATYFKNVMEEAFGIPVLIPEFAGYCNALGAALSKVTAEVNLFANTSDGKLSIPELNFYQTVTRNFSLGEAKELSLTKLQELLEQKGIDLNERLEVTEAQSFNMVRGFSQTGKSIRVKAQVKPGLLEQKY